MGGSPGHRVPCVGSDDCTRASSSSPQTQVVALFSKSGTGKQTMSFRTPFCCSDVEPHDRNSDDIRPHARIGPDSSKRFDAFLTFATDPFTIADTASGAQDEATSSTEDGAGENLHPAKLSYAIKVVRLSRDPRSGLLLPRLPIQGGIPERFHSHRGIDIARAEGYEGQRVEDTRLCTTRYGFRAQLL